MTTAPNPSNMLMFIFPCPIKACGPLSWVPPHHRSQVILSPHAHLLALAYRFRMQLFCSLFDASCLRLSVFAYNCFCQKAADVWEKDVWEFQAKSGSSGSCCLFLYFLGKIAVQEMSGRTPGSPRHPSSRHPRPSDSERSF